MSISLSEISDHLENAHEYSGYWSALCPFHSDSKPSLMIYPDHYYCTACGARGSLEYLLAKIGKGYYVPKNQVTISPNWGKWLSDTDLRGFSKQAHSFLMRNKEYQLYLKKRGIISMLEEMRIGFRDGYFIFPIFNSDGTVINLVARCGETLQEMTGNRYFSCPFEYSGNRGTIYCTDFELIQQSPYIIVVFGIFDLLSLGVLNVPSITFTNGKNLPANLVEQYRKIFYIIGDAGEEKEAKQVACSLGWRGRFINLTYPAGCKDMSDIFTKHGKDKVLEIIKDITTQDIHNFALEVI